ncbi:MAG: isochorismatase family protein, partial [Anaerolineaceae bacterium]|nr:isochorismatase family protein [Anaerolineaceae bacterium]
LCGQETHVCVLQTALELLERGYRVFVAGDAVCSRQKINWQFALDEMRQAGCVIEPVESILFKMLERAGTEEFRAISRLVK